MPYHDPNAWNFQQFVEAAPLTLFGNRDTEGFNERERVRLSPILKKLLEARDFVSLSELFEYRGRLGLRFLDTLLKCPLMLIVLIDGRFQFLKAEATVDNTLRHQPYTICLPILLKRRIGPLAVIGEVPDIVFQDISAKSNEAIPVGETNNQAKLGPRDLGVRAEGGDSLSKIYMAGNDCQLPRRNGRSQSQFVCVGNAVTLLEQVVEDVRVQIREHRALFLTALLSLVGDWHFAAPYNFSVLRATYVIRNPRGSTMSHSGRSVPSISKVAALVPSGPTK